MYHAYYVSMNNEPWTWPYETKAVAAAEVLPDEAIDWSPLRNLVAELIAYPLTLITYLYK